MLLLSVAVNAATAKQCQYVLFIIVSFIISVSQRLRIPTTHSSTSTFHLRFSFKNLVVVMLDRSKKTQLINIDLFDKVCGHVIAIYSRKQMKDTNV